MNGQLIVLELDVMMGKPVIGGTRITVELILDELSAGATVGSLIDQYPQLKRESVLAAIAFARDILRSDVIYLQDKAA
jgi:uncharacterized protein (DUF433 family)